ncbi:MAG: DUF302 domain-containing protein [Candidatus Zixiibacteriota bacterium]
MGSLSSFIIGLIVGAALVALTVWFVLPNKMLHISESNLSLEETVAKIEQETLAAGWKVPKIYDLQKTLQESGYEQMTKMKILSICQPDHAFAILEDDENKMVAAMMPCRIGVYETADGTVKIAQMNIGLMSKMFGGTIEKVMGKVAAEEEQILKGIIATSIN